MGAMIDGSYYTDGELIEMGLRRPDGPSGIDPNEKARSEAAAAAHAARGGGKQADTQAGSSAGPGQTTEDAARAQQRAEKWLKDAKEKKGDWAGKTADAETLAFLERITHGEAVSWDREMREGAGGMSYDLSDLDGIMRNAQHISARTAIDEAIDRNVAQGQSGGMRFDNKGKPVGGYQTDLSDDPDIRAKQQALWGTEAETMPAWARGTNLLKNPSAAPPAPGGAGGAGAAGGAGGGAASGGGAGGVGAGGNTMANMFTTQVGLGGQYPGRPTSIIGDFGWSAPRTPPIVPYGQAPYAPAPQYGAPTPYQAGTYTPPVYDPAVPFAGPTAEQMAADPGYQFRLQQGQEALERSGAARGVTNTGGTLKDILDYGQRAASQEYGNVYNRMAGTYGMNEAARQAAFDRNALQGWQSWQGNEVGRARAYDVNEANRAAAFGTNEANRRNWYDVNAAQNLLGYQTNANMRQQDYLNQYNNWVQSYNQWRQQGADRFGEQYQLAMG